MATINEQIVTGRKFRKLVDEATKLWQRISFWTKASDVEFNDGKTAEEKLGKINGITNSLNSNSSNIVLSAAAGNNLQSQITQLTNTENNLKNQVTQLTNTINNLGTQATMSLSGTTLYINF